MNKDYTEWCGEFRGLPISVAISKKYNHVLILTSDYLFRLDCSSKELIEYEPQPQYQNLTVTPSGDFSVAGYYGIDIVGALLEDKKPIESPVKMDMFKFGEWTDKKLSITCDEFLNWDNQVELELDAETLEINIKRSNKRAAKG